MSNNDILAIHFNNEKKQLVIVGKIVWKHYPNGDWFIAGYI